MKNKAKCKLCDSIIESFHPTDYVVCKCEHIAVYGGDSMHCAAVDWSNFVRVDDEGNEINVKLKEPSHTDVAEDIPIEPRSRADIIDTIDHLIKTTEDLPQSAMIIPLTHYDMLSILYLLQGVAKT